MEYEKIYTVPEFLDRLRMAEANSTLYIKGCFGAPMNPKNKIRYTNNLDYNKNRSVMIDAATESTFGFDCVNLIKGILWGWDANISLNYGGASYKSHSVPDCNADGIMRYCNNVSQDFSGIEPGAIVWMPGHVGIYMGGTKVIECTPKWTNNVQYSNLANLGAKDGHSRSWWKWGLLPWIDYGESDMKPDELWHTVQKGDNLITIGKKYKIGWVEIAIRNEIEYPYIIRPGERLRIR